MIKLKWTQRELWFKGVVLDTTMKMHTQMAIGKRTNVFQKPKDIRESILKCLEPRECNDSQNIIRQK